MRKFVAGILLAMFAVICLVYSGCANSPKNNDNDSPAISDEVNDGSPIISGNDGGTSVSTDDDDFTPWVKP